MRPTRAEIHVESFLANLRFVRKQIGEDLQRIRALKREDPRQWYYTLEEGYKLAKDQKQADWAHD